MSLSEYLLADITRAARRPTVAQVLERAGQRTEGVPVGEIVEAVRSGRPR